MIHNFFNTIGVSLIFCTIVLGFLIKYERRKHSRKTEADNNAFWSREAAANSVRRKDISQLPYIRIPFEELPFIPDAAGEIKTCQNQLLALKGIPLLNLSSMSNTDLKMEYGVANLPKLSECDEACNNMYRIIANLGYYLSKEGYHDEAVAFLEFGIRAGSDLSRNYYVLADEYLLAHRYDDVRQLITRAESITTPMKSAIIRELTGKLASTEVKP